MMTSKQLFQILVYLFSLQIVGCSEVTQFITADKSHHKSNNNVVIKPIKKKSKAMTSPEASSVEVKSIPERKLAVPQAISEPNAEAPEQLQSHSLQQPYATSPSLALLDEAKGYAAKGEGELAASSLERALQIEPDNPWIWHRLAVLRLQQGKYFDAIQLAKKSISLAIENARLLGGNWQVIGEAQTSLGELEEAKSAKALAKEYFLRSGS